MAAARWSAVRRARRSFDRGVHRHRDAAWPSPLIPRSTVPRRTGEVRRGVVWALTGRSWHAIVDHRVLAVCRLEEAGHSPAPPPPSRSCPSFPGGASVNRSRAFRRLVALSSALVIVASIAVPAAWAKPPDDGPAGNNAKTTSVQILSLNDFHGQLRPPDALRAQAGASARRQRVARNTSPATFATCGRRIRRTRCSSQRAT